MDLSMLNNEQRAAAEHVDGPLLILAGAGSGKTRVLTYRIANLIENHGASPYSILALTFTNKAAKEMRDRTARLLGMDISGMWVMTFHSFCARILRSDIDKIGRQKNFVIYDDSDQLSIISDILKQLNITDKSLPKREVSEMISDAKNKSGDPAAHLRASYADGDRIVKIYNMYQQRLLTANALDFDDLLLCVLELLNTDQEVLEKYRNKFKYVLVDEYQDTNGIQYQLVHKLCETHKNICVVGDDDQSIYAWRGADVRNILEFEKDFPGAMVVRLEQNYRSTGTILDAANAVVANNASRKKKKLWTQRENGAKIELYSAPSERHEADYMCRKILEGRSKGMRYDDFAVLYRVNALSRVLETTLVSYGIPHKVYGGQRFYERMEIKDMLAYLRLLYNLSDDVSLKRVINVPRRGIGGKTIEELEDYSLKKGVPLFIGCMEHAELSKAAGQKLKVFADMLSELVAMKQAMKLSEFAEKLVYHTGYDAYLKENKQVEYEARMDNIRELIGNIIEFEKSAEEGQDVLAMFLENVALISDIDSLSEEDGTVALMTMHSAKGLEFPTVFMVGMENNLFPSMRSRNTLSGMEEERRLCYVGITRAMNKLYLLNALERSLYGESHYTMPSCFIEEIPGELIDRVNKPQRSYSDGGYEYHGGGYAKKDGFGSAAPKVVLKPLPMEVKSFTVGQRVSHAQFGEGEVISLNGSGDNMLVEILFKNGAQKRFAAAYAPIRSVE